MSGTSSDRLINLFGALALGVSDRIRAAAAEAMPAGGETAAALVVIGHGAALSIDQLSRVLRMSHPGAVRLVDRLVGLGLVERRPSDSDRRIMHVVLTEAGVAQREKLLALRHDVLRTLLDKVSARDRGALERAADAILASLPQNALSALTICRFCNEQRCPDCPMDQYGPVQSPA
jgi:MarR family transcriptional repressor of emrRAB